MCRRWETRSRGWLWCRKPRAPTEPSPRMQSTKPAAQRVATVRSGRFCSVFRSLKLERCSPEREHSSRTTRPARVNSAARVARTRCTSALAIRHANVETPPLKRIQRSVHLQRSHRRAARRVHGRPAATRRARWRTVIWCICDSTTSDTTANTAHCPH